MVVGEHLAELRRLLLRSGIVLVTTTVISFIFVRKLFNFLMIPAGDTSFIFTRMTEMISVYMKVALVGGLIVAFPFITYQVMAFILPALTREEKRTVYLVLPWIIFMFVGGWAFGYYVLLPPALGFLVTFGNDIAVPMISIESYITMVMILLIGIGLTFEVPVIITFLSWLGVINPQQLSRARRWAVMGNFVLAAVITPTIDPINMVLVAIPLVILYEVSILLARVVYRRRVSRKIFARESIQ